MPSANVAVGSGAVAGHTPESRLSEQLHRAALREGEGGANVEAEHLRPSDKGQFRGVSKCYRGRSEASVCRKGMPSEARRWRARTYPRLALRSERRVRQERVAVCVEEKGLLLRALCGLELSVTWARSLRILELTDQALED